jgi:hypothetical protein
MASIRVAQESHQESGTDGTHSFMVIRIRRLCFYTLLGDVHSNVTALGNFPSPFGCGLGL